MTGGGAQSGQADSGSGRSAELEALRVAGEGVMMSLLIRFPARRTELGVPDKEKVR